MANFEIQGKDGKTYEIEAPDIQAATAAFRKMNVVHPPLNEDDRETRATDQTLQPAGLWPFSKVRGSGEVVFDQNAGLLGSIISGVTAPGDVATGKLDPQSPEAIQRSMDFTMLASPTSAASRAGEQAISGSLRALHPGAPKPVPTTEMLKDAAKSGYESARNMGVDYSADAIKSMAAGAQQQLEEKGILDILSPKTFSILRKLQEPPEGAVVSLPGLVAARRALQNAAGDFTNPTEQKAATGAMEILDRMLMEPDEASVVAGPAAAAGAAIKEANANYASAMRSDKITGAEKRAEFNAAVANSGLNIGNQLRQRARDILLKPKEARGFSKEELAALEMVAKGTATANVLRRVGNLLGSGGGLGQSVTGAIGGALGGSVGGFPGMGAGAVALPLAGVAARKGSEAITQGQMRMLDELIRQRSPLFMKALENPSIAGPNADVRSLFTRPLLMQDQRR